MLFNSSLGFVHKIRIAIILIFDPPVTEFVGLQQAKPFIVTKSQNLSPSSVSHFMDVD